MKIQNILSSQSQKKNLSSHGQNINYFFIRHPKISIVSKEEMRNLANELMNDRCKIPSSWQKNSCYAIPSPAYSCHFQIWKIQRMSIGDGLSRERKRSWWQTDNTFCRHPPKFLICQVFWKPTAWRWELLMINSNSIWTLIKCDVILEQKQVKR